MLRVSVFQFTASHQSIDVVILQCIGSATKKFRECAQREIRIPTELDYYFFDFFARDSARRLYTSRNGVKAFGMLGSPRVGAPSGQ